VPIARVIDITKIYATKLVKIVSEHPGGVVWILRNKSELLTKAERREESRENQLYLKEIS
jgi:hypothetical protein